MKGINIINSYTLRHWEWLQLDENQAWVPVRPEGRTGLLFRLRCAWLVFTGKADILCWNK
jgi:hypothetical protein